MLLIAKIGNSSRKPQNPLKKLQQRNKVAPADCQCHQSIHLAVYSLDNKNDCLKSHYSSLRSRTTEACLLQDRNYDF
jgi:hypothetical protein